MKKNRSDYEFLFETQEEGNFYINHLFDDHVWGGDVEMSILSKIYNCIFVIHASGRPDLTVFRLLTSSFH